MNNYCYIHIPFCTSKCSYCRFATFGSLNDIKINIYVKYLIAEIQKNKTDYTKLKSVYFGGGTPSVLTISQLGKIINILKIKFKFDDNIEINIEATPITITKENLLGWKKLGITRISMGVQTLNNKSLVEIGRGEKGDIIKAFNIIEKTGFNNISIDFIIGLPYIKKGDIKKDINYILNKYNFIKHISVYMLEEYYYPGNWNNISISDNDYLGEYIKIKDFLKSKGFTQYEVSSYALNGYECKHNKGYWNHSNMLAFGLGAHGFEGGYRYSNSESFLGYYSGKQVVDEKLTQNDYFIESVMFGLRTSGLNSDLYTKLNTSKIEDFFIKGYLIKKSDKIILSDKGVLVMDYILSEII